MSGKGLPESPTFLDDAAHRVPVPRMRHLAWFDQRARAEVGRDGRAATTTEHWKQQLIDVFTQDHGPASQIIARR